VGWLTAGIAVLMVSLYGHVSLVVRARRAIGEYRAALIDDSVLDLLPLLAGVATPDTASRHVVRELGVVVKGFDLYHEQGCAMTAGREIVIVSRSEAADSGLVSCGICCRNSTGAPVGGPQ
jgi:hypothetical protein